MPSPGTTIGPMKNSPTSFIPTVPHNFHSTSKLYHYPARLPHGWPCFCFGCLSNSSWWKHTQEQSPGMEKILHGLRNNLFLHRMLRNKKLRPWELLPCLYAKDNFQDLVMLPWLKAQSAVPLTLTLWLQPSGKMEGMTQHTKQRVTMHNFYSGNWGHKKRTNQRKDNRKPYLIAFFISSTLQKLQNSNKQWKDSWELPTSGQCALASITKSQKPNNGKQNSYAYKKLP